MTRAEYLKSLPDEEFIRFEENRHYGYKSPSGEILIPAQYSYAPENASERMKVWVGGKCGYINKAGEEVMPIIYDDLFGYCNEARPELVMYMAEKDGKYGLFDKDFNVLIPMIYDNMGLPHPVNPTPAQMGDKWGYINYRNEPLIDFKFDDADSFTEDVAFVKIDGKYGYINTNGEMVIAPQFDDANAFSDGAAVVMLGDKWGHINHTGEWIIEPKYDNAENFNEGMAAVMKDDLWGFVDMTGKEVIPIIYEEVSLFYDGKARVETDEDVFYIDKSGKIIE